MNPSRAKLDVRRDAPAWLVSAAVHAVLLILLAAITWVVQAPRDTEALVQLGPVDLEGTAVEAAGTLGQSDTLSDAKQEEASAVSSAHPLPAPPLPVTVPLPPATLPSDEPAPLASHDPALSMLASLMDAPSSQPPGATRGGGLLDGTSDQFQTLVRDIQRRGLDVVFVLDATDSMTPYIEQAKARLRQIMGVIGGVLEEGEGPKRRDMLRFGIVAFKDYGDDYGIDATRTLPLTLEVDLVRQFIDDVTAGGGQDIPEPIDEALACVADRNMGWQRGRRAIVILVTDAPVHTSSRRRALEQAKTFAERFAGTVNVIDVGGVGEQGAGRGAVLEDLANIAKAGRGEAFLLREEDAFWQHLVVSVFGTQFEHDVQKIVEKYGRRGE